jgi:hypothetical protein
MSMTSEVSTFEGLTKERVAPMSMDPITFNPESYKINSLKSSQECSVSWITLGI